MLPRQNTTLRAVLCNLRFLSCPSPRRKQDNNTSCPLSKRDRQQSLCLKLRKLGSLNLQLRVPRTLGKLMRQPIPAYLPGRHPLVGLSCLLGRLARELVLE